MKQIRQGVFETNSSSVHSLSVNTRWANRLKGYSITGGYFGEFGWGHERLHFPEEKLSYLLVAITYKSGSQDHWSNLETIKGKNLRNSQKKSFLDCKYFKWLDEAMEKETGAKIIFDWEDILSSKFYPFGYIDHQSECGMDVLDMFWSEDKETFQKNMLEFIFNEKYGVIIDNDNH